LNPNLLRGGERGRERGEEVAIYNGRRLAPFATTGVAIILKEITSNLWGGGGGGGGGLGRHQKEGGDRDNPPRVRRA